MSIVRTLNCRSDLDAAKVGGGSYDASDGNWRGPYGYPVWRLSDNKFAFTAITEGGAFGWWETFGTRFGDTYIQLYGGASQFTVVDNDADHKLHYRYGPNTAIHPTFVWRLAHFYWVEMEWKWDDTAGYFKVWLDGDLVIDVTGDTANGGTAPDQLDFLEGSSVGSPQARDWVLWTKDGSGVNASPGEICRLIPLATASDEEADFGSTGANLYTEIDDDNQADGDTTKIEATIAGDRARFGLDIPATWDIDLEWTLPNGSPVANVFAVIARVAAADSASTSDLDVGIRELVSNVEDVTQFPLTTTYVEKEHISELNPDTGLAWTVADLSAGVQLVLEQQ